MSKKIKLVRKTSPPNKKIKVVKKTSPRKQDSKPTLVTDIKILSNPELQKGVYSNVAVIHHTNNEFLIDFLSSFRNETQLVSRVILSPKHMKALQGAIDENLKSYEKTNK